MTNPKTTDVDINAAWELESGLIDDVDAWIVHPRFGTKEDYMQAIIDAPEGSGLMFMIDLVNVEGELLGSQGYSVGTGWEASEDGRYLTHATRSNVVKSTLYGQLQTKVVKDLGISMGERGVPTDAEVWNGLGFHWTQTPHFTVSGVEKSSLMPTMVLEGAGPTTAPAPAPAAKATPKVAAKAGSPGAKAAALKLVGECTSAKEFMMKAIKVPAIVADDALMAECMDDGDAGFYAQYI